MKFSICFLEGPTTERASAPCMAGRSTCQLGMCAGPVLFQEKLTGSTSNTGNWVRYRDLAGESFQVDNTARAKATSLGMSWFREYSTLRSIRATMSCSLVRRS